jgi:nitrate reductase NapD
MNISGILVVVPVEKVTTAIQALNAIPGVEVHHADPARGRIVVTQEADSIEGEVEGIRKIKALPDVILAEMVHHYFEPEGETSGQEGERRGGRGPSAVPPNLND